MPERDTGLAEEVRSGDAECEERRVNVAAIANLRRERGVDIVVATGAVVTTGRLSFVGLVAFAGGPDLRERALLAGNMKSTILTPDIALF